MPAVSANMGLTRWTTGSDLFDYVALSGNFLLLDTHDHTTNKGVQIPTAGLANLAVTTAKLADVGVTTAKLADAAVTAPKLDLAVALVPVGALLAFGGPTAPAGWLLCNGLAQSRTTFASLFTVLSTTYGVGDGSTTFNVPDMRGRVPVGVDGVANRLDALDALGNSGGVQKHPLTGSENGPHSHATAIATAGGSGSALGATGMTKFALQNSFMDSQLSGSGDPHNNMQPYQIANWIIKT